MFLKASVITASVGSLLPEISKATAIDENKANTKEFYELKVYSLKNGDQQKLVEDFYEKAAIAALNKAGSTVVGVFRELKPEGQSKIYVLITYKTLEDFLKINETLWKDPEFTIAGAPYLNATAANPAFERIESSLLQSFSHMPKLISPQKKSRIFELRRYESPTELAGKKKIEMFNEAGEIDIFKRDGLTPVFFGETIIGALRPNLTYMITFDDMAAHDKNWKTFGNDPEWKKISSIPEYADARIISRITSTFLIPTAFSQI